MRQVDFKEAPAPFSTPTITYDGALERSRGKIGL